MKRHSENVALSLLVVFVIASSVSVTEAAEDDSEPAVSETELRYFDVTTLKYGEEPDLGIPDEYRVPVEVAFGLAKIYRDNYPAPDIIGEFTGDYSLAYDFQYGYYEYAFFMADPSELPYNLKSITSNLYELAKKGEVDLIGDDKTGTVWLLTSDEADAELAGIFRDPVKLGYNQRKAKCLLFVPADKRGKFRVHRDSKDGLPFAIDFTRYQLDCAIRQIIGDEPINRMVFSSNPSSITGVILADVGSKKIFFTFFEGIRYYVGDVFFSSHFYEKSILGNKKEYNIEGEVYLWNEFIEGISCGDKN
jgi:hypothetical protein